MPRYSIDSLSLTYQLHLDGYNKGAAQDIWNVAVERYGHLM